MELSKRLMAVAGLVKKGDRPADIGCDHGYVSIYLIKEKVCSSMIAMDINKGPLLRAKENVENGADVAIPTAAIKEGPAPFEPMTDAEKDEVRNKIAELGL